MKKLLLIAPLALSLLLVSCNNKDNENKGSDEEQTSQNTPTSGDQTPPEKPWTSLLPKNPTEIVKLNIIGDKTIGETPLNDLDEDDVLAGASKLVKNRDIELDDYGIDGGGCQETYSADYYLDNIVDARFSREDTYGPNFHYQETYTEVSTIYENMPIAHIQGSVTQTISGESTTEPYDCWNVFPGSMYTPAEQTINGMLSKTSGMFELDKTVLVTDDFYYLIAEKTENHENTSPAVFTQTDYTQYIFEFDKELRFTGYYQFHSSIANIDFDTLQPGESLLGKEINVSYLSYDVQKEYPNKAALLESIPGRTVMIDFTATDEQLDRKSYVKLQYHDATVDGNGVLTAVGSTTNEVIGTNYYNNMIRFEKQLISSTTDFVAISEIDIKLLIVRLKETPHGETFQSSFEFSNNDPEMAALQAVLPDSSLQTLDGKRYIVLEEDYLAFLTSFDSTLVEPSFTFKEAELY